jgi:hypothetical protein
MSLTAAALLVLAACSDNTGPTMGSGVSLTFASDVTAGGAPAPGRFGGPAMVGTFDDGANTLILESVKIVLREIELERVEVTDCDVEPEPDGCEKFETEPILVDLPLDGTTNNDASMTITMITPGMYDEVEFDIHEVTGNADDAAFLVTYPEMNGKSIVVEGDYCPTTDVVAGVCVSSTDEFAFVYESDLNEEQELLLPEVLVISEGDAIAETNVTIRVNVSTWFKDGTTLFNPSTANKGGANENLAETNIRDSFKAFEDKDKDGDDTDES